MRRTSASERPQAPQKSLARKSSIRAKRDCTHHVESGPNAAVQRPRSLLEMAKRRTRECKRVSVSIEHSGSTTPGLNHPDLGDCNALSRGLTAQRLQLTGRHSRQDL